MAILTDQNYVDRAEQVIRHLSPEIIFNRKKEENLTITKLRNLLTLTSTLYDEAQQRDFTVLQDRLAYLRVQFVYQSSRESAVKKLVKQAKILEVLQEIQDKESLIRFCRYMEALVAYFKYYGGKDS